MKESKDVVVLPKTAMSDVNYGAMEEVATNTVLNLSNAMDTLLHTDESTPLDLENVDKAIDCADAMVKVMAMFHKGREIQSRTESLGKLNGSN